MNSYYICSRRSWGTWIHGSMMIVIQSYILHVVVSRGFGMFIVPSLLSLAAAMGRSVSCVGVRVRE